MDKISKNRFRFRFPIRFVFRTTFRFFHGSLVSTVSMSEVMSDVSVESDAETPEYVGSVQPYMFEPTMSTEEADAHLAKKKKADSDSDGRHAADVQTWYVVWVLVKCGRWLHQTFILSSVDPVYLLCNT